MLKKLLGLVLTFVVIAITGSAWAQTISISASTSDTICSGTRVAFTAVATGGSHYKWIIGTATAGTDADTFSTAGLTSGAVVYCELTSASGGGTILAVSGPITFIVEHTPVVAAITGSDSVCLGATTNLSDDTASGSWNTTNPFIASVSSSGVVTGVAVGLDTISYTLANSCGSASAMFPIYVGTTPFLAPITGPATICRGATATYVDSPLIGTWSAANGRATITSAGVASGVALGADTIFYSATNTCGTTTRRRVVTIETTPTVGPITSLTGTTLCQDSVAILTDATNGGMWHSLEGMVANVLGSMGAGALIRGNAAGTATIVYVVNNGCGVDSSTLDITIDPAPVVYPIIGNDSICPGSTESLLEIATGGSWSSANAAIASVDVSGTVTGVAAGTTTITYSSTNSCGTVTQSISIAVYCPSNVSVPLVPPSKEIAIFPNPAHDMLTIQGTNAALVQVTNMYGQAVASIRNSNTISINSLPGGLYIVSVFDANGNIVTRQQVVKE